MERLILQFSTMIIKRKLQHAIIPPAPQIFSIYEESAITRASRLILNGKVIALPTDTVYGIAVSAQNNNGIKKLYEIKKRDKEKPIAICVSDINEIQLWGKADHLPPELLKNLLPGAVTIILKRKKTLNPLLNPNTDLIGIRIPDYSFVQNLAKQCGVPLALTSANLSSQASPLQVSEFQHLWPDLEGIFDGGALGQTSVHRAGSTVVDLSSAGYFKIIRSGSALDNTLEILQKFGLQKK